MEYQTVKRGKITYYITETSVVVSVGASQYVSYNIYNNTNKAGLSEFKKLILASKEDEYGNVIDKIGLTQRCKIIGSGTSKPSWIKE